LWTTQGAWEIKRQNIMEWDGHLSSGGHMLSILF
jgi:hypothetical protein